MLSYHVYHCLVLVSVHSVAQVSKAAVAQFFSIFAWYLDEQCVIFNKTALLMDVRCQSDR